MAQDGTQDGTQDGGHDGTHDGDRQGGAAGGPAADGAGSGGAGEPSVRFDEGSSAYVLEVDGSPVGRADVRLGDGVAVFTHTEVDPDRGGQGLGTVLVREALADAARRGLAVEPACAFVAAYLRRHPDAARRP
ncbi:GNAT family N-acetyltransferase [Cellulomonas endophytica]|uniref:GNAT family N-acetyltransferase n=1 Tax=Cellulomonas endophytica TaxID=2494735 RepID=UPI001010C253|nr:GNAT family N-acetyltransferase [Cellulomonas endophytica]